MEEKKVNNKTQNPKNDITDNSSQRELAIKFKSPSQYRKTINKSDSNPSDNNNTIQLPTSQGTGKSNLKTINHKNASKFKISKRPMFKILIKHKKLILIFICIIVLLLTLKTDIYLSCKYLEPLPIYKNILSATSKNKIIICQDKETDSEQVCYFNRYWHFRDTNTLICTH